MKSEHGSALAATAGFTDPTSLYVHIPFCGSRCHYCDFTTFVAPRSVMDGYVEDLKRELAMVSSLTSKPLRTVFFGGGTPTALDSKQLAFVLSAVTEAFDVEPTAEWTVEANPGTVNEEKLSVLRERGVNRLSFGAQTFEDRLLLAIGRSHDSETIESSVQLAQSRGFTRINLDLMFGLPEQSLDDVREALNRVVQLGVHHVSAYWLKVEPGTPFHQWREAGLLPLPGEDAEADMYHLVRETLKQAGFHHYEVSNFATEGEMAEHNLVYWRNEPYLAAGVGAHGYVNGTRYENHRVLQRYSADLMKGTRPVLETNQVDAHEAMEDTMMLGLRLSEGVSKRRFLKRHGKSMEAVFGEAIDWGLRNSLLTWDQDSIRLTDRAWPIANVVFEKFVE